MGLSSISAGSGRKQKKNRAEPFAPAEEKMFSNGGDDGNIGL
jgi:hypothetical protein